MPSENGAKGVEGLGRATVSGQFSTSGRDKWRSRCQVNQNLVSFTRNIYQNNTIKMQLIDLG